VHDQESLLGPVASASTAFRVVDRVASTPGSLDALRSAHARGHERFWERHRVPARLTIDVDATLITTHSEKEHAAGKYSGGYGFHPLVAYADETREALASMFRPGNAGANARIPARNSRSPTMTGTASKQSSPTKPTTTSRSSSARHRQTRPRRGPHASCCPVPLRCSG